MKKKQYDVLSRGDFFISISRGNVPHSAEHPDGLKKYEYSKEFIVSYSSNISYYSNNGVHLIFSGSLFQNNPAKIIFDKYILYKEAAFNDLNGKFALCVFDENSRILFVVTDRVSSYKIFYRIKDNTIQIGTDIDYFKKENDRLDMGAIGSYLINGAPMRNKTIYKDILKVPPGSYINFDPNNSSVTPVRYWKFNFTNEYKNIRSDELAEELKSILIRSFNRRLSDNKRVLLSFSGGSDSRGMLALLTGKDINYENIEIFTYKYGSISKGDPTDIAQQITKKKGYKLKVIDLYNGSIENTIRLNAKLGRGIAHHCTDVDVWESIKDEYSEGNCKIFVGDIADGVPEGFRGDYLRALEKNYIYQASLLDPYCSVFKNEYFDRIVYEYLSDYDHILKESMEYENILDSMWHTYLDQRISNTLNVYRENFISYFIDVETPFYDNEVLDFLAKLPLEQRLYKKVFLEAYKTIDPEIMKVKYSDKTEESIDWNREIKKNRELLNSLTEKSRLDSIISENQMKNTLNSTDSNKSSYSKYLYSVHRTINSIFPNYYRILLSDKMIGKINMKLKSKRINNFYLKYIILRRVLSNNSKT